MGIVDLGALDVFLASRERDRLIGHRPDGRPHATPNWFLWDGAASWCRRPGSAPSTGSSPTIPRVQVVVDDPTGFRYVVADGTVEWIKDIDEGLDYFQRLRETRAQEASREELHAEMERDGRVLLVIGRPCGGRLHAMGL